MSKVKKIVENKPVEIQRSFISRWSQHKYESGKGSNNLTADNTPIENQTLSNETLQNQSGENIPVMQDTSDEIQIAEKNSLTDKDMPDINSLTDDSDYTDFLSSGVSESLRKLALRKLFHSEVFNICDGLDDYDDDYTQFKKLGDIVTSDMRHQIELTAQRLEEKLLADELAENSLVVEGNNNDDGLNVSTADIDISINRHIDNKDSDDEIELLIPAQQINQSPAANEAGGDETVVNEVENYTAELTPSTVKTAKKNDS